jgi:hypothetical protein
MSDFHLGLAALLRRAAEDPFGMARLRQVAESALGLRGFESDAEVLDALITAGARGKLAQELLVDDERHGAWSELNKKSSDDADHADDETEDTGLHAIQFRVVDDETGEPRSGVALTIKLTTGESRQFITNAGGLVRISGIPGGTCDIERMVDSEAFEVVALQSG